MSSKPVTIDNLGIGPSQEYALSEQYKIPTFDSDSQAISQKTQIASISTYNKEMAENWPFSVGQATAWASFSLPKDYAAAASRVLSYALIPSLEDNPAFAEGDTLEEWITKTIETLDGFASQMSTPQEKKETKKIRKFLKDLQERRKMFDLLRGRCLQFQRG